MPAISGDAIWVAYISAATNLVVGDTNSVKDVFLAERSVAPTSLVVYSTADTAHPNDTNGNGGVDPGETPSITCPVTCTLRAALFARAS